MLDAQHYDSKSNKGRGAVYEVLRQLVVTFALRGNSSAPKNGSKVRNMNEMKRRTVFII